MKLFNNKLLFILLALSTLDVHAQSENENAKEYLEYKGLVPKEIYTSQAHKKDIQFQSRIG
jgi:hypothetical protein